MGSPANVSIVISKGADRGFGGWSIFAPHVSNAARMKFTIGSLRKTPYRRMVTYPLLGHFVFAAANRPVADARLDTSRAGHSRHNAVLRAYRSPVRAPRESRVATRETPQECVLPALGLDG